METLRECYHIFSQFVLGKTVDSFIIGWICFFLMTILRLPFTPIVSLIVGITNMIPYFGPFIGAVPGIVLILVNLPTKNSPPGRHGQEGCFQSISFTIPAAWRSVLEIQRSESENLLGFCHIPQILPSGTWRLLLRSPPLHPAPTERIRRF